MLDQLIQQSDKLIRELFGQYRDNIEKESLNFKNSLKKIVDDIIQKLIDKEEQERKQEDNNIKEEFDKKLEDLDYKHKQIVKNLFDKEEQERKQQVNNIKDDFKIFLEDFRLTLKEIDKLDKKNKHIESLIENLYSKIDILSENQNKLNLELSDISSSIDCLKNGINTMIKMYIRDNPKDIRKSFFDFKKKNNL